ncbi:hypothetical protein [Crateriforma conspicua]|uniref:hypothetical protein n=1 Tax=Crateriforma conspicua TaxID=2527996 RepID=UPI00118AD5EB|nr:hypothetical protein [Crateriforma conspicua]QDV63386.1 hypothetical protein Mal65_25280 [Crateriforma conspicua]
MKKSRFTNEQIAFALKQAEVRYACSDLLDTAPPDCRLLVASSTLSTCIASANQAGQIINAAVLLRGLKRLKICIAVSTGL